MAWYIAEAGSPTALLTPYGPYSSGSVFLGHCDGSQKMLRTVCGQGKWVADGACKAPAGGEHRLDCIFTRDSTGVAEV
jgi:hypothetical protein